MKHSLISSSRKLRVVESLCKGKYFTLSLGLFTSQQIHQIEGSVHRDHRIAMGAVQSLPKQDL
eukprot:scaffold112204_cov21-Prasinocladus_malaysianus.AAC.2